VGRVFEKVHAVTPSLKFTFSPALSGTALPCLYDQRGFDLWLYGRVASSNPDCEKTKTGFLSALLSKLTLVFNLLYSLL